MANNLYDEDEEQNLSVSGGYSVDGSSDDEDLPLYSQSTTSKSGTSSTRGSGNSHSDTTTDRTTTNIQDRIEAQRQEYIPIDRSSLTPSSAYQAMLGKGQTPLTDPSVAEKKALQRARMQSFADIAKNLAVLGASHSVGATGPINRDTQNQNYIKAMNSYYSALPNYNKALAQSNKALIDAQKDLAKAQMDRETKFALAEHQMGNKVEFGNANRVQDTNKFNSNAGRITKTEGSSHSDKNFNNNSTTTTMSRSDNDVWKNPKYAAWAKAATKKAEDNDELRPAFFTVQKGGELSVDGTLTMKKGQFRSLLYAIQRTSQGNGEDFKDWFKQNGVTNTNDLRSNEINALQKALNKYYTDHVRIKNQNGELEHGGASGLNDEQLEELWQGMGKIFANYANVPALKPWLSKARFFDNQTEKEITVGQYIDRAFKQGQIRKNSTPTYVRVAQSSDTNTD